jgi:hypothetical protein
MFIPSARIPAVIGDQPLMPNRIGRAKNIQNSRMIAEAPLANSM